MTVMVRVEERILDEIKKEKEYCNVISKSDAMVTKIYSDSGEIIVSVNDIVKKDDVLISGNIVLNEENRIIDFNETLLNTSKLKSDFIRNKEMD